QSRTPIRIHTKSTLFTYTTLFRSPAAHWRNVNESRSIQEHSVQSSASETEKRLGPRRQGLARLRRRDDRQGKVLRVKRFIRCSRQDSTDSRLQRLQLRD